MPRLVCVSDTHLSHERSPLAVPDGDVLVHAGDATRRGTLEEIGLFNQWFSELPHPHKVFVAGNHDFGFEQQPLAARAMLDPAVHYLQDAEVTVAGLRIWGSPWQPRFFDWAFNLDRGPVIRAKWRLIPAGVDVVITHGPPMGILDTTVRGTAVGCQDLRDELTARVKPRVHVFGHIHEGHGREDRDGIAFVNASTCDVRYRPVNPPIVVDL